MNQVCANTDYSHSTLCTWNPTTTGVQVVNEFQVEFAREYKVLNATVFEALGFAVQAIPAIQSAEKLLAELQAKVWL